MDNPHNQRNMEIDFENWEPEERLLHYVSEKQAEYQTKKRNKTKK